MPNHAPAASHPPSSEPAAPRWLSRCSAVGLALVLSAGLTSCEGESTDDGLPDGCTVLLTGGVDDREAVQTALIEANDGDTLCFSGRFDINDDRLSLSDKSGLTLRGIDEGDGPGVGAVFDFNYVVGPTGFKFANMSGLTLDNISVLNAAGDGVEVRASTDIIMRRLKVDWERGIDTENGAYAMYPVEVERLLVEDCETSHASDAGVYVGQSRDLVVRRNTSFNNVTGIQVENSTGGEVYENTVYGNTAGIFVHDLPAVPAGNGGRVWVHHNTAYDNNTANFAPDGIIAKVIPPGLGILVLAMDQVEVSDNTIYDNNTAGLSLVSFTTVEAIGGSRDPDPDYDRYPEGIYFHDNTLMNNGTDPDPLFKDELGFETTADIMWDGIIDGSKPADDANRICMRDNGEASYLNFDMTTAGANPSYDITVHDCALEPLGPLENGLGSP